MATGTNNKIPLSDKSMPHTCQNKLVKFRVDILSRSREIQGSFSWGGADSAPPPTGEIGLRSVCSLFSKLHGKRHLQGTYMCCKYLVKTKFTDLY